MIYHQKLNHNTKTHTGNVKLLCTKNKNHTLRLIENFGTRCPLILVQEANYSRV